MENPIIVAVGGVYYDFFYNLAFLVAFFILLYEGHRRKFPLFKWLLLLLFSRIFFIIGSKVITYSSEEWLVFFRTFTLPETPGKSLAGGFLLGFAALMAGKFFLKFREPFVDAFAVALPLAIGIQRLGCFFAGCCYGTASQLPWAVKYPVNTLPHFHQYQAGQLAVNDFFSLAIHPVQLYEMIGAFIVTLLVFSYRKHFKAQGSLILYSFGLIFLTRFVSEFFRDPLAHTIGGKLYLFMNATQWVILPAAILCFGWVIYRETRTITTKISVPSTELALKTSFIVIMVASVFIWTLRNWFAFAEMLALAITITAAVGMMTYRLARNFYLSPYRWQYMILFAFPVILMAQTYPEGSADSLLVRTYKSIGLGYSTGQRTNEHDIGYGEGCDRVSNSQYFDHEYSLAGAHYSITKEYLAQNEILEYGIRGYTGSHSEKRRPDIYSDENFFLGINPYVNFDMEWVGVGGGLHIGNLVHIFESKWTDGSGLAKSGVTKSNIYPQLRVRLGQSRILFVDYRLADHFPSALPGFRQQLGLGSGFGSRKGMYARLGTNFDGAYLSGYIPLNNLVFEPHIVLSRDYGNYSAINDKKFQFSLGVSYRFGYKVGPRK